MNFNSQPLQATNYGNFKEGVEFVGKTLTDIYTKKLNTQQNLIQTQKQQLEQQKQTIYQLNQALLKYQQQEVLQSTQLIQKDNKIAYLEKQLSQKQDIIADYECEKLEQPFKQNWSVSSKSKKLLDSSFEQE